MSTSDAQVFVIVVVASIAVLWFLHLARKSAQKRVVKTASRGAHERPTIVAIGTRAQTSTATAATASPPKRPTIVDVRARRPASPAKSGKALWVDRFFKV